MTQQFTSTMGAPLSQMESEAILQAWAGLAQVPVPPNPDPLEMLSYCNTIVMHIHEVRRSIDNGWYGANRRRWPAPAPKRAARPPATKTPEQLLSELRTLGVTNDAVLALLNKL